ncbi:hypothetical protein Tco_1351371 [Tanacetum coccineum]
MEAHLSPKSSVQVNKIASSFKICSGPYDTQYCMENPEQAFVDYASSPTNKAGGEMTSKINTVLKDINDRITGALLSDTVKNPKLNVNSISPVLSARSYPTKDPQCSSHIQGLINAITMCSKQPNKYHNDQSQDHDTIAKESKVEREKEKGDPENINTNPPLPPNPSTSFIIEKNDGDVMFIEIIKKYDDSFKEELKEDEGAATGGLEVEYFYMIPTRSKLAYHKYLMCGPIPSLFFRNPVIIGGCLANLKIPCNIGHVHVEKAYIYLNSPLNVMTRMQYNWIMRKQLKPREDPKGIRGMSNFTGRIKGTHIFIRNFTYVTDFMIFKDISSIIDPRLSQVVLGKPFVEISNITHDLSLRLVKFTSGSNEISYKMPHKTDKYNSLSYLEKEHTKSIYFRNEEDKRTRVEYVMNKILGLYKECLELGPEYLIGLEDGGGVT